MGTSNQHTPKQTGQQGFGSVETLLCEKIKPACCGKFARGLDLGSFVRAECEMGGGKN